MDTTIDMTTAYENLETIVNCFVTSSSSLVNETRSLCAQVTQCCNTTNNMTTISSSFVTAEMTMMTKEMASTTQAVLITTVTTSKNRGKIISDELRNFFEIMNFVILSGVISFFGCIANIINIIMFVKQGFTDTVNIALLGLAVSDFGALITLVWMSICFNPLFRDSGISFNSIKVQYLTAGWPHVCFARITSWITAYVTFERCLCIALPLKVKHIITPRRTVCVIVSIFVILIAAVSPVYYAISLGPVFNEEKNRTLISLVYRDDGPDIENVSFAINVFAQLSSFVSVIICTIILVQSLVKKKQLRSSLSSETITQRDRRVIKMVISLSFIFITCFLPSAINLIIMLATPGYSIVGQYQNIFQVGWSFLNTLEATNSSVNIIVYYKMSSRYRLVFKRMFCPKSTEERKSRYADTAATRNVSTSRDGEISTEGKRDQKTEDGGRECVNQRNDT